MGYTQSGKGELRGRVLHIDPDSCVMTIKYEEPDNDVFLAPCGPTESQSTGDGNAPLPGDKVVVFIEEYLEG